MSGSQIYTNLESVAWLRLSGYLCKKTNLLSTVYAFDISSASAERICGQQNMTILQK